MLLFQTVIKNCEVFGISRNQDSFRRRFLMNLIVFWLISIWTTASLLCRNHDFDDYLEYIYLVTSDIILIVSFTIIGLNQTKLFELIDTCEGIIRRSEWAQVAGIGIGIDSKRNNIEIVSFRTRGVINGSVLRWSQSTNWEMEQTHLLFRAQNNANQLLCVTVDY